MIAAILIPLSAGTAPILPMVPREVSLSRFPWNHGKVLTKKSGPGIAPEARPYRRGVHPPAAISFYIATPAVAVKL
jgi:hypothetical protein